MQKLNILVKPGAFTKEPTLWLLGAISLYIKLHWKINKVWA